MAVVEVRRDRPDLVAALAHLRCTEWNHAAAAGVFRVTTHAE
ncbi:hypothetical protein [Actinoplanes sp. NPDC089786]